MKHLISTIFSLILYHTSVTAQNNGISTNGENGTQHPYAIIDVTSEREFVTIHSDSLINNAHIIIKDNIGNIIYDDIITIIPSSNTIYISEGYDNEKYTIEIFYDEKYLIGIFKEE